MKDYINELSEQLKQVETLLIKTEKRLESNKVDNSKKVRISYKKGGYQYYLENEEGKREYVKTKDLEVIRKILQKDYDKTIHDKLLTIRYRIYRFIKIYDMDAIERVYDKLPVAKKMLVKPIIQTDEEYIKSWLEKYKSNMNTYPEQGMYLTEKGENVRSKSEKILADLFSKYEIPYSYEPQFKFDDGSIMFPDFALLNTRTRETIYWEHFGIITDGEYATRTLSKLNAYEKNGLEVGRNLLYSMESESIPLDIKQIEKKIKHHLL